jgi:predicted O-linked N-acetylglucosamine transferase (SPINDLY family)
MAMSRVRELFELADGGGPRALEALAMIARRRRETARSFLEADDDDTALERRLVEVEELALVAFPWERTAEGEELAAAIEAAWRVGPAPSSKVLMAAMALAPAHHFPDPASLGAVAPWLRRLYATHLTVRPQIFVEIGEAQRYAEHATAVMRTLASAIIDEPLPEAESLADIVAASNATMTYFNDGSLKDYFAHKARIIEWLMFARGYRLGWSFPLEADRPLRVGVVHRSLEPGAESAYLLAHLAGREKGEGSLTIYTTGNPPANMINAFAPWVSQIVKMPDDILGAVMRLRRDQLDVCYFANNLVCALGQDTAIAAHRVARVQIIGGASPASPGYLSSDLFASSHDCDPGPSAQDDYEERLVYIQGALRHFAYAYDREPNTIRCSREIFGIPPDHVIYFSAANYFKHTPEITAVWAEILARAPNSSLVLMPFNPNWGTSYPVELFVRRLHETLARAGVSTERVKVVEKVPTRADLQVLMSKADVYLDSFPYSGACSLVDPLSVGLPVVARSGRRLRTAQGGALLAAEGLQVCPDAESYIARAVRLAEDKAFRDDQIAIAKLIARAPPSCLRTRDFARRFSRFCADAHLAHMEHYAALRGGTDAQARAAVKKSVAIAKRYASPVFRHIYGIDVVARILVPYLKTRAREGLPVGRTVDVGSAEGHLAAPFCRAGFKAEMLDPDPAFAAVVAAYVKEFPDLAEYDATPLSAASAKSPKKGAADAPSPLLGKRLSEGDDIDIVRFDAARTGFGLEAGLDLVGGGVKIVMADFNGTQSDAASRSVAKMKARGFGSVLLTYRDLSALGIENWRRELVDVTLDPAKIAIAKSGFGLILFFKDGDTTFLAHLAQLLEACGPARTRPWSSSLASDQAADSGGAWLPASR